MIDVHDWYQHIIFIFLVIWETKTCLWLVHLLISAQIPTLYVLFNYLQFRYNLSTSSIDVGWIPGLMSSFDLLVQGIWNSQKLLLWSRRPVTKFTLDSGVPLASFTSPCCWEQGNTFMYFLEIKMEWAIWQLPWL